MQIFFIFLIVTSILFLVLAFKLKDKVQYYGQVMQDVYKQDVLSKKKIDQEVVLSKKTKEQIMLELIIVKNIKPIYIMALIDKNIKLKLIITALLVGLGLLIFSPEDPLFKLIICLLTFIMGIVIPGTIANSGIKTQLKKIMDDLPMFIDLTAVCVQTGIPIDSALRRVSEDYEKMNKSLSYVMQYILKRAEITGLIPALGELSLALPTKEVKMFVTTMQQSLNFGSSVYEQLITLSADIRDHQLLSIEERLGTLSAKMSIPLILFIMFPIIILILAPGAMQISLPG